jgi:thioredoxin 1
MQLESSADFAQFIQTRAMSAVYFTAPGCAMCGIIRPKLQGLLAKEFPAVGWGEVDCGAQPELAAQQRVLAVPTLVIYIDGREGLRKSHSFAIGEVAAALERPYGMLVGETEA